MGRNKTVKQSLRNDLKYTAETRRRRVQPDPGTNLPNWKFYLALVIILILAFLAFMPVLQNEFVNWDDPEYIVDNKIIQDLSWNGIRTIFFNFHSDNYAPLTDLISAVLFKVGGSSPAAVHAGSLFFHLLNIVLVCCFIQLLSGSWLAALISALLFGLHPVQVESVAWASARSNLFYAAFFLGSLITYLYYLRNSRKLLLVISLLLFVLSVLSKAVAVVLPLILLLIDYYRSRELSRKVLLEKLPYLVLAIGAGILTYYFKSSSGALRDIAAYPVHYRIAFAGYGFLTYLYHLVLPIDLSAYYPYPIKKGDALPGIYYLYPLFILCLLILIFYSSRFTKKIIFSIGFFAVSLILLLQLIPVGDALMADRYMYIPMIGMALLAGEGLVAIQRHRLMPAGVLLLVVFAVFFSFNTYARCSTWKNSMALWNGVIEKNGTIAVAFNNRGALFMEELKYDLAMKDYNRAIELNREFFQAYYNRGVVYMNENKYELALENFSKAIGLNKNYTEAYYNRGIVFTGKGKYSEALSDYNRAIELNKNHTRAFVNRGNILRDEGKVAEALADYNKAISMEPDLVPAYISRGTLFLNEKKNNEAIKDFTTAITLKPDYVRAYYNRGIVYRNEARYDEAIIDFTKAISLKADFSEAYYNRARTEYLANRKDAACKDMKQAASFGYKPAADILSQICN